MFEIMFDFDIESTVGGVVQPPVAVMTGCEYFKWCIWFFEPWCNICCGVEFVVILVVIIIVVAIVVIVVLFRFGIDYFGQSNNRMIVRT